MKMGSKAYAWRESSSRIIFLITILIQALLVAAVEIYIFTSVIRKLSDDPVSAQVTSQDKTSTSLLVYLIIFIMSQLLQIYMTLEAMAYKNTLQVIGIVVFNVMSTGYSWVQYYQIKENIGTLAVGSSINYEELKNSAKIALACMGSAMIVCELVLIVFAYKLYQEFGWSIYRLIGSDLTMRRLYLNYQMLVMFLKFDVFFFLGFSIQFLILALKTDDYEFYITLVAIPLSLVILIGVIQGVRREHKAMTLVSMMGFLVGLAYFIFKTYRIFDKETAFKYKDYRIFLTLFAVLSIVALTVSYILTLLCYLNFGKGLERHIHPSNALNLERPPQAHIDLGDE